MIHWGTVTCDPPVPTDVVDEAWRNHLIEHCGVVGLSNVTHDNIEEWLWRITFLQATMSRDIGRVYFGAGAKHGKRVTHNITPAILRRWAGLWTNWSTYTRKEFVQLRLRRLEQDTDAQVRHLMAEDAKPKPKRRRATAKSKR